MTLEADRVDRPTEDPVSNVLKWILLAVAVVSFALFAWATVLTYERAPPQPERFVGTKAAARAAANVILAKESALRAGICGEQLGHGDVWVDAAAVMGAT